MGVLIRPSRLLESNVFWVSTHCVKDFRRGQRDLNVGGRSQSRQRFSSCFVVSYAAQVPLDSWHTCSSVGNFVAIQFAGTQSSRDAIGVSVSCDSNGRKIVRQVTAGDGYQASNQHEIIFGCGAAQTIQSMTVVWPSGQSRTFDNVSTILSVCVARRQPVTLAVTISRIRISSL